MSCSRTQHNASCETLTKDPSIPKSNSLPIGPLCSSLASFRNKLTCLFCFTPVEGVVRGDGLLPDGGSGAPNTGKAAHLKACWKT